MRVGANVVVLRHVTFEDLGVIGDVLGERGMGARVLEVGVDALDVGEVADSDLAVVLGGPIGVGDRERYPFLVEEQEAVRARLEVSGPTLGVCLGAQLMAAALGAEVSPTGRHEIGWAPLGLTAEGRDSVLAPLEGLPVLHWHGDQFAIPRGARRLAETPGFPNQAFDLGPRVLGLQFHLEVRPERIESWLVGHAVELAAAGVDPRDLREQARTVGVQLPETAREIVRAWVEGALA